MISTSRLHLRPWRDGDLPAMAAINADPRVMAFFPSVQTEKQTEEFIGRQQQQQQGRGYCYFAAEQRASGTLIGFIGIAYQDYVAPFTPCVDIGWRLHPDFWGQGYATEGAAACLDFAFTACQLTEVLAVAVRANQPSIKVMQRLGMAYRTSFQHPALKAYPALAECVVYGIQRPGKDSG